MHDAQKENERQSKETRNHNVQAKMTTCLRCGMKISEFTKTCPNCGYNNRTSPNRKTRTSKTSKKIKQDTKRTSKTTTRTNKTTTKPGKRKKKTRKTKEHNYVHPKEAYSPYNDVNISAEEFNRRQKKLRERALENRRGYGRH